MSKKVGKYIAFKDARKFARKFHLSSRYEWILLANSPEVIPSSIPVNAEEVYAEEWKSWKDFLGYKKKVEFLTYDEAKKIIHPLKLKGLKEWKFYTNWDLSVIGLKPPNIPSSPHITYEGKGWVGYADFLGNNNKSFSSKVFMSFESARKYSRALGLTSSAQWVDYCQGKIKGLLPKPENVPSNIARQYADMGFKGMNDFLNTKYHREVLRREVHRSFDEARRFVHSLKLKNLIEWNLFIKGELAHRKKLPPDIPSNPKLVYKDSGWVGYGDWLGTFKIPPFQMVFISFEKARGFARKLGLTSSTDWISYCKGGFPDLQAKPDNIPHSVARHYQDSGWVDYQDFLMDGKRRANYSKFLPYEEAKSFVNSLKLKNVIDWQKYLKGGFKKLATKPDGIPSNPANIYKDKGWVGMGEWLDNGSFPYAAKDYRSFKEAKQFARSLGLLTSQEWALYCKGEIPNLPAKPVDIPANVVKQYTKKGWAGFKDFLGTRKNRIAHKKSINFLDSKEWAKDLKMKSSSQWKDYCSGKLKEAYGVKPQNIPSNPEVVYLRSGWTNMEDWLDLS